MELSRSEQKRRIKRLEELVQALAALSPALIEQLPIDKELRALLLEAAALGRDSARRRLLKHVTKLLTRLAFLFAVSRNPRHSREIFRILKAAQERGRRQ